MSLYMKIRELEHKEKIAALRRFSDGLKEAGVIEVLDGKSMIVKLSPSDKKNVAWSSINFFDNKQFSTQTQTGRIFKLKPVIYMANLSLVNRIVQRFNKIEKIKEIRKQWRHRKIRKRLLVFQEWLTKNSYSIYCLCGHITKDNPVELDMFVKSNLSSEGKVTYTITIRRPKYFMYEKIISNTRDIDMFVSEEPYDPIGHYYSEKMLNSDGTPSVTVGPTMHGFRIFETMTSDPTSNVWLYNVVTGRHVTKHLVNLLTGKLIEYADTNGISWSLPEDEGDVFLLSAYAAQFAEQLT